MPGENYMVEFLFGCFCHIISLCVFLLHLCFYRLHSVHNALKYCYRLIYILKI